MRALTGLGVAVQLAGLESWSPALLPHNLRDPWYESLTAPVGGSATVHFSFPTAVKKEPHQATVNFTMFEAMRIPDSWVAAHDRADLIVLPTEHSRQAWIGSGVPESKLRLCPLGVRTELFRPGVPPLPLTVVDGRPITSFKTRFLNISEIGARKNLPGLLAAWLHATSPADDAVLLIKAGSYVPGSIEELGRAIEDAQRQAGKKLTQAAPVHFIHDVFPDADMPRIYAAATHYLSLSFGEGWDLAMVEAASSGLRLIAPRHSAYTTYLDDDVATLVTAREKPVLLPQHSPLHGLFDNASWWVPDEDEAVGAIRRAIAGEDAPKASARERMERDFTWNAAAARLLEVIKEAEAMATRR